MSNFSEQRASTEAAAVRQGPPWIWIAAIVVVLAIAWASYYFLYYRKPISTLDKFAQCLTSKSAKMYGAWWCPHCADQKDSFGYAFQYVTYVECSEPSQRTMNDTCKQAGIKNFPTWQFSDGSRVEGTQPLDALAKKTGCKLP
jgi:hypothetical protein